jgi:hypothetical protein
MRMRVPLVLVLSKQKSIVEKRMVRDITLDELSSYKQNVVLAFTPLQRLYRMVWRSPLSACATGDDGAGLGCPT